MTFAYELLLRVTLILASGFAASFFMRRGSAALRHSVWVAVIAGSLALPPVLLLAPVIRPEPARITSAIQVVAAAAQTNPAVSMDWSRALMWLWAAGAAIQFALIGAGLLRLRSILARGSEWRGAVVSPACSTPMTWGIAPPVIVLPEQAKTWSPERIETVLAHERAHILRGDWLWQMLAHAACAVYWFHPLAWLARTRMILESERACDDAVLRDGLSSCDYATHLIELARSGRSASQALAMARTSTLERRLAAMLNPHVNRNPMTRRAVLLTALPALILTVALAVVRAPAQTPGILNGVVQDATGATVAGASVTARNPVTKSVDTVRTGADGRYSFRALPSGRYDIEAANPGFALARKLGVLIDGLQSVSADIVLNVGTIKETLQVRAGLDPPPATTQPGTPGGRVQPARLLERINPVYPESAKQRRVEGTVIMQAVISLDGSVLNVKLLSASADAELAQAAIDALRQWRFEPARLNGRPVEIATEVSTEFRLD